MVLFLQGILSCLMLVVVYLDLTRFRIPNALVAALLLLYPVMLFFVPVPPPWIPAVIIGIAAFVVGFLIFVTKLMGGGDIKLLSVCALWTGPSMIGSFLIYTALFGGVLSIVLWLLRPLCARAANLPRVLRVGEKVPYGIAIAAAFLFLLWKGRIPGLGM